MQFPNLCGLINPDKFAHFRVGDLYLSLKRDGSVIWVTYEGGLHGLIESRSMIFKNLPRHLSYEQMTKAHELLLKVEADPAAAAKADGILTGRCSCCGRTLTEPSSIEIGVGPVCLKRAGWI